ncbi:hypothetical protein N8T08_010743 [Aspergillus melleus]|uniref:Uncharacterized protein n=1 Tax=Aspergillus melleus TaxID=138277 RepID=A0ACC3BBL8_9EURO|nr:hypothetical protein N8T08_010743 [Aspergillus melleus]
MLGLPWQIAQFLDLDQCYGVNADGNLIPLENGNYTGRCQVCSITYNGKMMCKCLDGDDKTVSTTIDLNDIISNEDGILHCHVGAGVDASCFQRGMWDDECP